MQEIEYVDAELGMSSYYCNGEWYWAESKTTLESPPDDSAIIYWLDGLKHRTDGPAVEYDNGSIQWWFTGLLHREGGPAIENYKGNKSWFVNGQRHRTDGPAILYGDGGKQWWIHNKQMTEDDFLEYTKNIST